MPAYTEKQYGGVYMKKNYDMQYSDFNTLFSKTPQAVAVLQGSPAYADIRGSVRFYGTHYGVFVVAEVGGLPRGGRCATPIFAFHIHEGAACRGDMADPFAKVGSHYNPQGCLHPYHAGDLPPLWGVNGYAFSAFLTARFAIEDIVGKTVVVHAGLDDFTTQPSGNAGAKIACGEIRAVTG